MIKKNTILALLFIPSISSASVLDTLKSTPASKYQVGKLQLELAAMMLTDKLNGERVKGSDFDIKKFRVTEESSHLEFIMSLIGETEDLTDQQCKKFKEFYSSHFSPTKMTKEIWPDLSPSQYKELEAELSFGLELISEDNESIKISC